MSHVRGNLARFVARAVERAIFLGGARSVVVAMPLHWPDLPYEARETAGARVAQKKSEDLAADVPAPARAAPADPDARQGRPRDPPEPPKPIRRRRRGDIDLADLVDDPLYSSATFHTAVMDRARKWRLAIIRGGAGAHQIFLCAGAFFGFACSLKALRGARHDGNAVATADDDAAAAAAALLSFRVAVQVIFSCLYVLACVSALAFRTANARAYERVYESWCEGVNLAGVLAREASLYAGADWATLLRFGSVAQSLFATRFEFRRQSRYFIARQALEFVLGCARKASKDVGGTAGGGGFRGAEVFVDAFLSRACSGSEIARLLALSAAGLVVMYSLEKEDLRRFLATYAEEDRAEAERRRRAAAAVSATREARASASSPPAVRAAGGSGSSEEEESRGFGIDASPGGLRARRSRREESDR